MSKLSFQTEKYSQFKRIFSLFVMIVSVSAVLSGCGQAKNQLTFDRSGELDREDYRRVLAPRPIPEKQEAAIPELASMVSEPNEMHQTMPLVSISVNQTVPLRDLLFELAEQGEMDLELDPSIRGSVIFTARNRPLDEVIDRITKMSGLRYAYSQGVLRVEVDRPYLESYQIDYINIIRTLKNTVTASNKVTSDEVGTAVGSKSSITMLVKNDFWDDLETNVEQILTSSDTYETLVTSSTPSAMPRINAGTLPVDPNNPDAVAAPVPVVTEPTLDVRFPVSSQEPVAPNPPATFSVNKSAGVITVYANARQQNTVYEYLKNLKETVTTQVLIEAKLMEVTLADEFSSGIDWGQIDVTGLASVGATFNAPALNPAPSGSFTATLTPGSDISAAVDAIGRFGTSRALSSPRLTVINQQAAVLSVVENQVFFEISSETTGGNGFSTSSTNVEARTVPEGIIINVVPSINAKTDEIMLSIRPSITRIVGEAQDPVNAGNFIPELSIKEIDSMVMMRSGQVMVMGGLMEDINAVTEVGVPVLSDVPLFGSLFKNHTDKVEKTEIVIFLKATIVPGTNVHDTDRQIYNTFSLDSRPFSM